MRWLNNLKKQLDNDVPEWWIKWANEGEIASINPDIDKKEVLSNIVSDRMFTSIIMAAIGAGVVIAPCQIRDQNDD
jgi:hypothetical protein